MNFLKLKEAAERLGISEQHLRKLCREKKIAHTRIGARYFLTAEQADALVRIVPPAAAEPVEIENEKGE